MVIQPLSTHLIKPKIFDLITPTEAAPRTVSLETGNPFSCSKLIFLSFLQVFEILWAFYLERIALSVDCLWEHSSLSVYISKAEDRNEALCQTAKMTSEVSSWCSRSSSHVISSIEFSCNTRLSEYLCVPTRVWIQTRTFSSAGKMYSYWNKIEQNNEIKNWWPAFLSVVSDSWFSYGPHFFQLKWKR